MKITARIFVWILFAILLASVHSCTTYRPIARQSGNASLQVFYDALSPYGEWVQNREYGFVWIPDAGRNFVPYGTNGRWIYTDYGWTWFSDYEWGWAPFHYGRWDYDPAYGWFWFPGDEWGPAWVNWRTGNGYYGWSPMRPQTDFGNNYPGDDINGWIFVRDRDFGRSNLNRYFVSSRRNDDLFRRTEVVRNNRIDNTRNANYSSGPDPDDVGRATGRRIRSVTVSDLSSPGRRLNGSTLEIYRPRVESSSGQRATPSRISDVKDVRPMRERDRNYKRDNSQMGQPPSTGQGRSEVNREQSSDSRERDARIQQEERQSEMQKRQLETQEQQQQHQIENAGQKQDPDRAYRQTRSERKQITNQQKKVLQKERQRNERVPSDTARSRRTETQSLRQNRR